MTLSRRRFTQLLLSSSTLASQAVDSATAPPWHEMIAQRARQLFGESTLTILIPEGCEANLRAGTAAFTSLSGISCVLKEVPVDELSTELIMQAKEPTSSIDVALPATFDIAELVQARAIRPLDDFASLYEPDGFSNGYLYRNGDHYRSQLYGYQSDGDAYLLFYNKRMLESPEENKAFEKLHGKPLAVARTWEELDTMMAFFHRPTQNQYGGCLFRNANYLVWEWWARFHSKGYFPVSDDMTPNINNAAGIAALEELAIATDYQSPISRTAGLFDNWKEYSKDNIFCSIGWGGTQKYMRLNNKMQNNLVHSPLPGLQKEGQTIPMGYFNWGWNYTVSTRSQQSELAYLFALFCTTPVVSTLVVRETAGFFDPFRETHYTDPDIQAIYGGSFLDAQRESLLNSIPDFYLSGQGLYLDALKQQLVMRINGEVSSITAMNNCAHHWKQITRRLGQREQSREWAALKKTYPASLRSHFLSQ